MTPATLPLRHFFHTIAGPIIWAIHFMTVYTAESWVCALATSPTASMRWIVAALTAAALTGLAWCWWFLPTRRARNTEELHDFLDSLGAVLAGVSACAILAVAMSVFWLAACTAPAG